jgi:hypothetical protein
MFVLMKLCLALAFIMAMKSISALKINPFTVKPVSKSSHVISAQIVAVQLALSVALVIGNPSTSAGKLLPKLLCTSQLNSFQK